MVEKRGILKVMKAKKKTILVIEDDKRVMAALIIRLESAGYTVRTANNGFEGLKQVLSQAPDLLLMDIWTPFGMGFSVAQYLHKVGMKDIPIIFITGSRMAGLRDAAEQLGAIAFLEKPYDPKELLYSISKTIGPGLPGMVPRRAAGLKTRPLVAAPLPLKT
jgi:CheY-like chemotaxis protein